MCFELILNYNSIENLGKFPFNDNQNLSTKKMAKRVEIENIEPPAKYMSAVWENFGFPKGLKGDFPLLTICKIGRHEIG